ncbi:NUDIX hydrolase [Clostridioides difficile]
MIKNKVQNLETLSQTKFLSLYNANYINKGGNKKTWTIATRKSKEALEEQFFNGKEDKVDAVVILAYHKDEKKLVAIRQFRIPLNNYVYELPAGLIDNNDDIISTVKRELKEETGLDLEEVFEDKMGQKLYLSPGMTDESVSLVYCTCSGEVSTENLEEDEDIETVLLSREDAQKILNSNERCDIKFFMALQAFITLGDKLFL